MPWKIKSNNYNDAGVDVTSDARVLFDAVKHGKTHLMRFILEASAVDIVNSRDLHGKTPLMACCYTKEEGTRDKTAKLLLRHGADVNATDDFGRTALSYVCEKRCNDILRILVKEHNVDPDIADMNGTLLLTSNPSLLRRIQDWATLEAKRKRHEKFNTLPDNRIVDWSKLKGVADNNLSQTPLMYSAMIGNDIACDILIRHFRRLGLDVDAKNSEGFTALLLATKHGNITCAQILLGQGKASLEHKDSKFNLSAEDWLSKKGFTLEDIKPVRVDGIGRTRFVKVANVAICATPKKVPLEEEEDATIGIDFNVNEMLFDQIDQIEDEEGYSSDTNSRNDLPMSQYIQKYGHFDLSNKHYKVFPELNKPPMVNQETQTSDTDDSKTGDSDVHHKAVLRTNIDVTAPDPEPTDVSVLYKKKVTTDRVNKHTTKVDINVNTIANTNIVKSHDQPVKKASITCQTDTGLTVPCQNDKRFSLPNIGAYDKTDSAESERKHSMDVVSDKLISKLEIKSKKVDGSASKKSLN